nr:immunoglobulin heavy chain junction region [Macaca mulatta]MOY24383.1 immunoglobulin heavy chain junction region [Macaca mulatta]MOY25474.1 immunoglobulin heavy chain junction region [Macaca mulatta]MOY26354.1 immunoglobulin heavy chain junction region [Macaca mulatta]MOY27977.1 immunoglobulin heavy chain junction region [Macaca mulatta]
CARRVYSSSYFFDYW